MCMRVSLRFWLAGGFLLSLFLPQAIISGERVSCSESNPPPSTVSDAHAQNLALFPWGEPRYTESSQNTFPRPAWVQGSGNSGGILVTNDAWFGWQPALTDWHPGLASNRLLLSLIHI